ncbi:MAG: molybdopterin-guanine dinucleotide biosynthesis protein B, partial [Desulfobulbaceae bacterium]|nr:molybdopterin-guanine dinucleotide biosynthesis protein B [Desulfobulbaceae bacterium]
MPPIITFIGWHDSGKTTLALKVLALLRQRGRRVAAIKSTHKTGIIFDPATTDTGRYGEAGADGVLLAAPDQLVLQVPGHGASVPQLASLPQLAELAEWFFPDHDLVIAEGFKQAAGVAKIEVRRHGEPLAGIVDGVVAVVADMGDAGDGRLFRPDQIAELTDFIEEKIIVSAGGRAEKARVSLTIGGQALPLKNWVQEALAGTVLGFVSALKKREGM